MKFNLHLYLLSQIQETLIQNIAQRMHTELGVQTQIGIFINISSSEMQIVCTTALNQLRRNLYFCPAHFSSTDFTSYVFGKWESRVRGN